MIIPSDIVFHLAEYLPRVTDLFSETLTISTAVISGSYTITVDTASAHNLVVGSTVLINTGKTPNEIASVAEEVTDVSALITFSDDHDFTTPNAEIGTEPLPTVGFNEAEWNTTLEITSCPTRQSVIVNFPTTATGIPTFTPGNSIGYEERPLGIFGLHQAATVPTTTQFTIVLDSTKIPPLPNGTIIDMGVATSVRVAAADNIDRADEIYAKQTNQEDLWAFVIMLDTDISKDRNIQDDSVASYASGDAMRLRILQNFSVVVYFGSAEHISGATAQELAYGDVYKNLLGVLYGFSGFTKEGDGTQFVTVTNGHGRSSSNEAYYVQAYDWQLPVDITVDNGFTFYEDTALKRIESSFGMFTADNEEKLTLAFNVDP